MAAAWAGRECADESSEDIYGFGEGAPSGFPAVENEHAIITEIIMSANKCIYK